MGNTNSIDLSKLFEKTEKILNAVNKAESVATAQNLTQAEIQFKKRKAFDANKPDNWLKNNKS